MLLESNAERSKKLKMRVVIASGVSVAALAIAIIPLVLFIVYAVPVLKRVDTHLDNTAAPRPGSVHFSKIKADDMPTKWNAPFLLPQYFQEDRGTCWDFATIGLLEQSYRANGVANGFLDPTSYVRFSEQAYGISMMAACQGHPEICNFPGDFVYQNSTEGGEMPWLWTFTSLYDKVLPLAICPYTDGDHDRECPGMDEALKTNPIKFNINYMETAYSVEDSKRLLIAHGAPLGYSSLMHVAVYYMACDNDPYWSAQDACKAPLAVRCPTDKFYNSVWCARQESAMYSMDGEFLIQGNTIVEGGHALNAVGYNDEFVTKKGYRGGFIIKNSWHDKLYGTGPAGRGARGSHSVAYWMQQISGWDEKRLCPTPQNPDNWLSCVNMEAGPTKRTTKARNVQDATYDLSETCLSPSFMNKLVTVNLQPTEFMCTDATFCSTLPKYRYFLVSYVRNVEQDMAQICMLQYDTTTLGQTTICTPFANPSFIAYMFTPIPEQAAMLQNDLDFCGYYFFPYEVSHKQVGLYQTFFSTYFDITWDPMSYIANAPKYPGRDYSLVAKSTGKQGTLPFGTSPFPFGNVRY